MKQTKKWKIFVCVFCLQSFLHNNQVIKSQIPSHPPQKKGNQNFLNVNKSNKPTY